MLYAGVQRLWTWRLLSICCYFETVQDLNILHGIMALCMHVDWSPRFLRAACVHRFLVFWYNALTTLPPSIFKQLRSLRYVSLSLAGTAQLGLQHLCKWRVCWTCVTDQAVYVYSVFIAFCPACACIQSQRHLLTCVLLLVGTVIFVWNKTTFKLRSHPTSLTRLVVSRKFPC